ncbi:CPBP family intramembrane metalloprotease [Lactobacillus sp. LC28-10]|uniref:CPBP family intramembrane metalloprotease n=1 Tax=Secundilactobacillus angelensis TaxID=2722706 RepID=A0ABX1KWC4_9LACO|nr:CPBP family intramembrane glutamic endopeptidase [Secundilactobacillus angelensis]MCH5462598.1 CPBP family glutamic-type intramembrane protease [Secundilactobacillus angelensis]NLR18211.1 CPBP family intramembrane metalloprotease [Secundilactobacillus angelensis]
MKLRAGLLSVATVVITVIIITLTAIVGRLTAALVPAVTQMGVQLITEVLAFGCWWGFNRWYPKAKVSWWHAGVRHQWVLVVPVVIVLLGDATLHPEFQITVSHILMAILLGFSVGLFEEYVFRGVLVSAMRQRYQIGPVLTAVVSGLMFSLVHLINASGGSLTMTLVQMLEAVGLGFFFAAVYLVTNSLWLPIIGHGLIDGFDILAFGTLDNTAGMNVWTSLLYAVVFSFAAYWLLKTKRFAVQISANGSSQIDFARQPHEVRPVIQRQSVSAIKTLVAIAIPVLELGLGAVVAEVTTDKWIRIILVDLIFLIGLCTAIYVYHDVLSDHWHRFKHHLGSGLLVAICGVIAAYMLLSAVRQGLTLVGLASSGSSTIMSIQTAGLALVASLTTLMAPFAEEIVFRHALFYQWRGRGAFTWLMLIVSSIAFGLVHWNNFHGEIVQMIPYMFVGALFGLIYYFSRNIWQVILTHFLFDIIQVIAVIAMFILAIVQAG